MKKKNIAFVSALAAIVLTSSVYATVVTFESLPLGNPGIDGSTAYLETGGGHYWNGSNGAGGFSENDVTFQNSYNSTFGSWDGFSYSNTTDITTEGFTNQYSAIPGIGALGSSQYAIAYFSSYALSPPTILFSGSTPLIEASISLTNTTYSYLDMRNGSGFSKKFGGLTGNDPDFLKIIILGYLGATFTGSLEFYLADFRPSDNSQDYILDTWTDINLAPLGTVTSLTFSMESSDVGDFGINTPTTFALDNLVIPEPAAGALALLTLALSSLLRRRS